MSLGRLTRSYPRRSALLWARILGGITQQEKAGLFGGNSKKL
jgi:hypothetical protein